MNKKKITFKRFGATIEPAFKPGDIVTRYTTGMQIKISDIDTANAKYECVTITEPKGWFYEDIYLLESMVFKYIPYHKIWHEINF